MTTRYDSFEPSTTRREVSIENADQNSQPAHPCLFKVRPRLGGFVRKFNTLSIQSRDSLDKYKHLVPKDSIIRRRKEIEEKLRLNITCPDFTKVANTRSRNHMIRVCSLVISTIMLLAQGSYNSVTIEHVKFTEDYLQCLQRANNYPPNIGKLLLLLSCLKNRQQIATSHMINPSEDDTEEMIVKELIRLQEQNTNLSMDTEEESIRPEQQDELQNEGTKNEEIEKEEGIEEGIADSTAKEEVIEDNDDTSSIHDAGKHFVEDGCIFQPVIYSFKVRSGQKPTSVMNAAEPPFPVYLDHAIGVIWILFRQKNHELGTDELLWCLRFLQKLKTCDGEYTEHVNICMQTIQECVIQQYMKMGSSPGKVATALKSTPKNEDFLEHPSDTVDALNKKLADNETITSGYNFSSPDMYSYMNFQASTPNRVQSATTHEDDKAFLTLMSLTYNEMVSRESNDFIDETSNIERPLDISGTSTEYMGLASRKSSDLLDISPKLMDFLLSTRKLLIDRLKEELRELYNLEKFMGTIDKKSFTAFITEDLARRLERLDNEDIIQADVTYMHHIVTKLINSLP